MNTQQVFRDIQSDIRWRQIDENERRQRLSNLFHQVEDTAKEFESEEQFISKAEETITMGSERDAAKAFYTQHEGMSDDELQERYPRASLDHMNKLREQGREFAQPEEAPAPEPEGILVDRFSGRRIRPLPEREPDISQIENSNLGRSIQDFKTDERWFNVDEYERKQRLENLFENYIQPQFEDLDKQDFISTAENIIRASHSPDPEEPAGLRETFMSGWNQMRAMWPRMLAMYGDEDKREERLERAREVAGDPIDFYYETPERMRDWFTTPEGRRALLEQAPATLPIFLGLTAATAIGGLAGSLVGPKGTILGGKVGLKKASALFGSGLVGTAAGAASYQADLYGNLIEMGVDHEAAKPIAQRYGTEAGGWSIMAPMAITAIAGRFAGPIYTTSRARNVFAGGAAGAAVMSPTEMLAEAAVITGEELALGLNYSDEERRQRLGAAGAVSVPLGGLGGGVAGAMRSTGTPQDIQDAFFKTLSESDLAYDPGFMNVYQDILESKSELTKEEETILRGLKKETKRTDARPINKKLKAIRQQSADAFKMSDDAAVKRFDELRIKEAENQISESEITEMLAIYANKPHVRSQLAKGRFADLTPKRAREVTGKPEDAPTQTENALQAIAMRETLSKAQRDQQEVSVEQMANQRVERIRFLNKKKKAEGLVKSEQNELDFLKEHNDLKTLAPYYGVQIESLATKDINDMTAKEVRQRARELGIPVAKKDTATLKDDIVNRESEVGPQEDPRYAFAPRPVQDWTYSKMKNELGFPKALPKSTSKKDMTDKINSYVKKGSFKQSELKESGLLEYIQSLPKENVTQEEIINYLAQNEIEIQEHQLTRDQVRHDDAKLDGGQNYRELVFTVPTRPEDSNVFKNTSHFPHDNFFLHIRATDRTTPDGKKVLFIEEMQSDWHQQGRKFGYSEAEYQQKVQQKEQEIEDIRNNVIQNFNLNEIFPQDVLDYLDVLFYLEDKSPYTAFLSLGQKARNLGSEELTTSLNKTLKRRLGDNFTTPIPLELVQTSERLYNSTIEKARFLRAEPVPEHAPFKSTDSWAELGIKRMIQEAVEDGYDYVAWTDGETQAIRWGAEGLRQFYDDTLNRVASKYIKNWNKISEGEGIQQDKLKIEFIVGGASRLVNYWRFPITENMRKGILEGKQAKYKVSPSKRIKGTPKKVIQDAFKPLEKSFKGISDSVRIIQQENELPAGVRKDMRDKGLAGQVMGVSYMGEVYIIADNITTEQAQSYTFLDTLMRHEGRHKIFNKIFGSEKAKKDFFNKASFSLRKEINQYLRDTYKLEPGDITQEQRIMAAEEIIVDWAKEGVVNKTIDSILSKLLQWIRKIPQFKNVQLTHAELRNLLSVADSVIEGKPIRVSDRYISSPEIVPAYMFAGMRATLPEAKKQVEVARELRDNLYSKGKSPQEIREQVFKKTGWFETHFNTDEWYYWLPDGNVKLTQDAQVIIDDIMIRNKTGVFKGELTDFLMGFKALEAYEALGDINVKIEVLDAFNFTQMQQGNISKGSYSSSQKSIVLKLPSAEALDIMIVDKSRAKQYRDSVLHDFMKTFFHEIQHAIQDLEGMHYSKGSSATMVSTKIEILNKQFPKLIKDMQLEIDRVNTLLSRIPNYFDSPQAQKEFLKGVDLSDNLTFEQMSDIASNFRSSKEPTFRKFGQNLTNALKDYVNIERYVNQLMKQKQSLKKFHKEFSEIGLDKTYLMNYLYYFNTGELIAKLTAEDWKQGVTDQTTPPWERLNEFIEGDRFTSEELKEGRDVLHNMAVGDGLVRISPFTEDHVAYSEVEPRYAMNQEMQHQEPAPDLHKDSSPFGVPIVGFPEKGTKIATADQQYDGTFKMGVRDLFLSVSDKFRELNKDWANEYADRIDNYFNTLEQRLGLVNSPFHKLFKTIDKPYIFGGKGRNYYLAPFEAYWRHYDRGRKSEAERVYNEAPEVSKKLIDNWKKIANETGNINVHLRDPNGNPLMVFDRKKYLKHPNKKGEWIPYTEEKARYFEKKLRKEGEEPEFKGGWRPIRKVRDVYFPRVMRPEVRAVMVNKDKNSALYEQLIDALMVEYPDQFSNREQAEKWLIKNHFPEQTTNDYLANIEKARHQPLPEIFYDYSWDTASEYLYAWAKRTAQVETFGQDTGTGEYLHNTARKIKDPSIRNYADLVKDNIYETKSKETMTQVASTLNIAATGTQLANFATALRNLIGGSALNVVMFGPKAMTKAYAEMIRDWKAINESGVRLGILGKDVMNILNDNAAREALTRGGQIKQWAAYVARWSMSRSLYKSTENIIRTGAMIAAKNYNFNSLRHINQHGLNTRKAKKYIAWAERHNLDPNKLLTENGYGPETAKMLRKSVNIPQGSYRIDMTPMYVDTNWGRFLFKYQKFSTQVTRLFYKEYYRPMIESYRTGDTTAAAENTLKMLGFFATGIVGGTVDAAIRYRLFNYMDRGPEADDMVESMKKLLEDDETKDQLAWMFDRAYSSMVNSGFFGVFGTPIQYMSDVRHQRAVANPLDPPGVASIQTVGNLVNKFYQQGYKLSSRDVSDSIDEMYALFRAYRRASTSVLNTVGIDLYETRYFAGRHDSLYVRKLTNRFLKDKGEDIRTPQIAGVFRNVHSRRNQKLYEYIIMGDGQAASSYLREELRNAKPEERDEIMRSARMSIQNRQPIAFKGRANNELRREFEHWYRTQAPISDANRERIQRIDRQYRQAASRAGLM